MIPLVRFWFALILEIRLLYGAGVVVGAMVVVVGATVVLVVGATVVLVVKTSVVLVVWATTHWVIDVEPGGEVLDSGQATSLDPPAQ